MKSSLILIVVLLSFPFLLYAQYASLQVQHPQQTSRYGQGTIEQAVLSIHPKGIYTENNLYLTFSARGLTFTSSDSIEVQLYFSLPDGAVITDLWLWIDSTTISKALMLDRWTASTIYENIVKRRRDPAVLYKTSANYYQLRVYPMVGSDTRRIKMTYLTKNDWTIKSIVSPLPTHIIRASKNAVSNFSVQYWPDGIWINPWIFERTDITGISKKDSLGKDYYEFALPYSAYQSSLSIVYQAPVQKGFFVQRYQRGTDGVYQFAVIPSKVLGIQSKRKVAILFDFDPTKSTTTAAEVISTVKSILRDNFSSSDSLNLIFSQLTIRRVAERWFAGDSAGIQTAFDLAGTQPLSSYSNLPPLLANGIDFIQNHGNDGVIWLISNTDQLGDYQVANPLIADLMKLMNSPIPIHVTDFNNTNTRYFYINGLSYYGNQYFYENLARQTKGSNTRISSTFYSTVSKTLQLLQGNIATFDIYSTLSNGFCYARFTPGMTSAQTVSLDQPIVQVGKFTGNFPLLIDIAGNYRNALYSIRITIPSADALDADSVASQVWSGQYITSLESQSASNTIINQIIDASLKDRVLSLYTAFLALEPNDTVKVCATCTTATSGGGSTAVKSIESKDASSDSLVQVFPNPFNSQTILQVRLPKGMTNQDVTFKIYNTLGQLIYTFNVSKLDDHHYEQFTWRGVTNKNGPIASGIYFAILSTPKGKYTSKLLMLK
jgi:Ca-activated chloride channel family protein